MNKITDIFLIKKILHMLAKKKEILIVTSKPSTTSNNC